VVGGVLSGLLDIYGYQNTPANHKIITGFIKIYCNFQAVINDNEHDTLTGLLNRKTLDHQISELFVHTSDSQVESNVPENDRSSTKSDLNHWVGMLDIDHFKSINDSFGHIYGDEVLLIFSELMQKTFRDSDLLFRYGGEEFVVVLQSGTKEDIINVFNNFRTKLESHHFPQVGQVTVSIGIVKLNAEEHTTTVLGHADKALYFSKENGRNQVNDYHDLINQDKLKTNQINNDIELF